MEHTSVALCRIWQSYRLEDSGVLNCSY